MLLRNGLFLYFVKFKKMKTYLSVLLLTFLFYQENPDPKRFEDKITAFETQDQQNPPDSEDLILFTGSSSIVMWKTLADDFEGKNVINRGFGGSHNSDVIYYFDRIIKAYNPVRIVYYEGDNDIASGKSPEQSFLDFLQVASMIKKELPDTKVAVLTVKPSPSRWHLRQAYEEYNERLRFYCIKEPDSELIDIYTPMIKEYGRPDGKLFLSDSLHMTQKGYTIWKQQLNDFVFY